MLMISMLLATIAFTLSSIGTFGCNFVEFVSPTLQPAEASSSLRIVASTHNQSGIWSYNWWDSEAKQYKCHSYPETVEIDKKWKLSRLLSSLSIMFGGLYLLSVPIYYMLNSYHQSTRRKKKQYPYQFWGTICLISCVCETFTLIFLRSNGCQDNVIFNLMRNHNCTLSTGAKCTYAAIVFWLLAGFVMMLDSESANATREQRGEEDANLEESLLQEVV